MPSFGKRTPLARGHFAEFEAAFGEDAYGRSTRADQGDSGRLRCFSRETIRARGDNLDIAWLRDESVAAHDELVEPEVIAAEIMARLQEAMSELEALQGMLSGEGVEA
jgi:type I restriction enzyme M protein